MIDNQGSLTVHFYDSADDALLKFAVIAAKYNGKWIFCKHKKRDTYEIPGGHREAGETVEEAARYQLLELCPYSVTAGGPPPVETFGMLYFAEVEELSPLPAFEMERIECFDRLPERLTYPLIQPLMLKETERRMGRV